MPPTAVTDPIAPSTRSHRAPRLLGAAVAAALALAAAGRLVGLLAPPDVVDRVTVVNDTPFAFHVEVSDDGRAWLGLGVARASEEHTFSEVVDQGGTWTFRWGYAEHVAGSTTVDRPVLARADWIVTVPAEASERLAELGVAPPPSSPDRRETD